MTLEEVIRHVESSDNGHATRFEPVLYASDPQWVENQEHAIASANSCNLTTARQIAVTSYGFYQLLGANIYAGGCIVDIIRFCSDPRDYSEAGGVQLAAFKQFIGRHGFDPDEDVSTWPAGRFEAFAAMYNGPGDVPDYVAAMRKAAVLN